MDERERHEYEQRIEDLKRANQQREFRRNQQYDRWRADLTARSVRREREYAAILLLLAITSMGLVLDIFMRLVQHWRGC